jgi:hypothetical protein
MPLDIEHLNDSPYILDILVKMEDVLDTMDVYVFKNWIDGEVVEGPVIRRYWADMTLKYPYEKMPDPRAGFRLLKHGIRVDFSNVKEEDGAHVPAPDNDDEDEKKKTFWLVRISIPRRLIVEIGADQLSYYEDEIDVEDIQDANDSGLDQESEFETNEAGDTDETV